MAKEVADTCKTRRQRDVRHSGMKLGDAAFEAGKEREKAAAALYASMRGKIEDALKYEETVSLTHGGWTSWSMEPYVIITAWCTRLLLLLE